MNLENIQIGDILQYVDEPIVVAKNLGDAIVFIDDFEQYHEVKADYIQPIELSLDIAKKLASKFGEGDDGSWKIWIKTDPEFIIWKPFDDYTQSFLTSLGGHDMWFKYVHEFQHILKMVEFKEVLRDLKEEVINTHY